MTYARDTRNKLRTLYVQKHMSLSCAAMQCGISQSTASRWKQKALEQGDNWNQLRAAHLRAADDAEDKACEVLSGFMTQYQATMGALNAHPDISPEKKVQVLASLADSFNKTVAASKRVLPETSQLATAMEVVQKLAAYIRDQHPQHAAAFVEVLEPFGAELARVYG